MLWEANILYWIQEVVRHDWLNPIVIGITKLGIMDGFGFFRFFSFTLEKRKKNGNLCITFNCFMLSIDLCTLKKYCQSSKAL